MSKPPAGVAIKRAPAGSKHKFVAEFQYKGKQRRVAFGNREYHDYTQHHDNDRRENYLKRSAGIRNKTGGLTKDDPLSANFWARRYLWSSREPYSALKG